MSPDVWLERNQHWNTITPEERSAYVAGQMHAYLDVFNTFNEAFKSGGSLSSVFEVLRDRATVAGVI